MLHLVLSHPQYSHISPNATGILAEVPVWYVKDRFAKFAGTRQALALANSQQDLASLPVEGDVIPIGSDAVRRPISMGEYTNEKRPTGQHQRLFAF